MPSQEDIDHQIQLLEAHRRTLAVYLNQLALAGVMHARPEIFHGIDDARTQIRDIKTVLRAWNILVEDLPDDDAKYQNRYLPNAFISYARTDFQEVQFLADVLRENGVRVWLDRDEIFPETHWKTGLRTAIRHGSYFIMCLSKNYDTNIQSDTGEELAFAVGELKRYPFNRSWFVPILLSVCDIPDLYIGESLKLEDLKWINWQREVQFLREGFEDMPDVLDDLGMFGTILPTMWPDSRPSEQPEREPIVESEFENSFAKPVSDAAFRFLSAPASIKKDEQRERLASFIEMAAKILRESIAEYSSTAKVSYVKCGEIKTFLWAVKKVVDTTDNYWMQDVVDRAHHILWRSAGGWGNIAKRSSQEIVPTGYLEDLAGQLMGIAKWLHDDY